MVGWLASCLAFVLSNADDVGLPCKATNCHLAARSCQSVAMSVAISLLHVVAVVVVVNVVVVVV